MDDGWPRSRFYLLGALLNWAMFLAGILLLSWGRGTSALPAGWRWALAILLAASVAGQFVAAYRLIAVQDEYMRALTAKRVLIAAGVTLTLAVFAGIAMQFLGVPALPMWLLYPLFWGVFGMVSPLVRSSLP
ncbi:hypothetical protein [Sphingosinicella sp. BN140058]|uniref:hypothetical protein n=1 Tax=Sphingosinicella sp. BN140058 TaxID=1892855 RepID=UPI001012481D|nr:hypothetical protein [Sphingosinicella sp. BN140058]QAY75628.1 hypothetical protein ETR14_03105 [Sphingosinicella sp. BN140058]